MIEYGVCYLTLCDRSYPKKLAYQYLEELQKEFQEKYGPEVGSVSRPYAFVKFGMSHMIVLGLFERLDSFIQKVKKLYKDSRAQRNLNKLNDDLQDVQRIMTKNIQDVLGRGEQLDRMIVLFYRMADVFKGMTSMSSTLSSESKKYLKDAKHLNWMALYQKYGPPAIVVSIIMLVLYLRFFWW